MKYAYIGSADFVRDRGLRGSSQDLDLITYLDTHTEQSILLFTDDALFSQKMDEFHPDIAVLYDCDRPRKEYFTSIIEYCTTHSIPLLSIVNDIFWFYLITSDPLVARLDGIISMVNMKALLDHYRIALPHHVISHIEYPFVNTNVYKDYPTEKLYDIVIYGALTYKQEHCFVPLNPVDKEYCDATFQDGLPPDGVEFYPLRHRLAELILQHQDKYRVKYIPKPSKGCWNCPVRGVELSTVLNQSYLCVATRSRANRCMQKYFEITASNCGIIGNIPTDYCGLFSHTAVAEVDLQMSDADILARIDAVLMDKEALVRKTRAFGERIRTEHGSDNPNTVRSIHDTAHNILVRRKYNII